MQGDKLDLQEKNTSLEHKDKPPCFFFVFILPGLVRQTLETSSSPICRFGARFPASSTNINLIKRQWLASEQANTLISIDEGAREQFMCINEEKSGAKQWDPASFGMHSQPHAGSLMTRGSELGQNSIGCCKMALFNSSVLLSCIAYSAFVNPVNNCSTAPSRIWFLNANKWK